MQSEYLPHPLIDTCSHKKNQDCNCVHIPSKIVFWKKHDQMAKTLLVRNEGNKVQHVKKIAKFLA